MRKLTLLTIVFFCGSIVAAGQSQQSADLPCMDLQARLQGFDRTIPAEAVETDCRPMRIDQSVVNQVFFNTMNDLVLGVRALRKELETVRQESNQSFANRAFYKMVSQLALRIEILEKELKAAKLEKENKKLRALLQKRRKPQR